MAAGRRREFNGKAKQQRAEAKRTEEVLPKEQAALVVHVQLFEEPA